MIYLRNRYYDPNIGRFISEDPIRDGLNRYVYCAGNPVMFKDPWGLVPTPEEAAEMAKQLYNFDSESNLADIDIEERTVSLSDGRVWEMHDLWVDGTVVMGVYQLVDDNGGYTELCAVFKGTSTLLDWKDNVDAYINTYSPNLVHARLFAAGLVRYHSDVEITFVGHSKGGGEAIAAALHTGKNAITFNAANFDFGNPIITWIQSRNINIKNYYIIGEILSSAIGFADVGTACPLWGKGTPLERHSIESIIDGL